MRAGTNRRRACSERTQNGPSYRRIYRRKYYLARYASDEAGLPIGFSVPSDRRAKLLAAVRQERSRGTEKAGGDEKREKEYGIPGEKRENDVTTKDKSGVAGERKTEREREG